MQERDAAIYEKQFSQVCKQPGSFTAQDLRCRHGKTLLFLLFVRNINFNGYNVDVGV